MNYALIEVHKQNGDIVEGVWIQNVVAANLDEAIERAKRYERQSSRPVAVIQETGSPCGYQFCARRLDLNRSKELITPPGGAVQPGAIAEENDDGVQH